MATKKKPAALPGSFEGCFTFSALDLYESCPRAFYGQKVRQPRLVREEDDNLRLGNLAHGYIAELIRWRMKDGPLDVDRILEWLKSKVDDVTRHPKSGLPLTVDSLKQEAAWLVEHALPGIAPLIAQLEEADEWGAEDNFYFQPGWKLLSRSIPWKQIWGYKPRTGGGIDLWWRKGSAFFARDWKTGKRRPKWFQMELYGLFLSKAFEGQLKTFEGGLVWLTEEGDADVQDWTAKNVKAVEADLESRIAKIQGEKEWPTNPSFLCRYCPDKACVDRR